VTDEGTAKALVLPAKLGFVSLGCRPAGLVCQNMYGVANVAFQLFGFAAEEYHALRLFQRVIKLRKAWCRRGVSNTHCLGAMVLVEKKTPTLETCTPVPPSAGYVRKLNP
jgi:hypothetical protein